MGTCPRVQAQQVVNRFVARPWFPLSWVPPVLPDTVIWDDMTWPCCSRAQGGLRKQLAGADISMGLRDRLYPPGGQSQRAGRARLKTLVERFIADGRAFVEVA